MCCFSGPVSHVGNTKIFARAGDDGRQLLAYQMRFSTAADVAMILPLPVPKGVPDRALRFIDLQGYPGFFDDLDQYHFEKLHHLLRLVDFDGYRGRTVLEVGCGAAVDLARFAKGGAITTGVGHPFVPCPRSSSVRSASYASSVWWVT